MNVYLMYKDADFVLDDIFPDNFNIQVRDLGLDVLFQSLSAGDEFLYSVVKKPVLSRLLTFRVLSTDRLFCVTVFITQILSGNFIRRFLSA